MCFVSIHKDMKTILNYGIGILFLLFVDFLPLYSSSLSELKPNSSTYDNGVIINQMARDSKFLVIPEGTYYFSTPLVLENCRCITINGNLIYNGPKGKPAVTVKGNNVIFDLYGSLSYGNTPQFDGETDKNTTIGLSFININNSKVYINEIKFFNENIRLSGIGAGCSYNKFSFGIVRNCMVGLRIYQEDKDGKRGWANENSFYGGRFTNFSDWKFKDRSIAIKIAGAQHTKDSYNSSNSNLFLKQCFEGFNTVVIAKNIRNCDFLYARLEGSKEFVKFVGECRECRVSYDLGAGCRLYNDSESKWIPIRVDEILFNQIASYDFSNPVVVNNASGDHRAFVEGCGFLDYNTNSSKLQLFSPFSKKSPKVYEYTPAINIASAGRKVFRITGPSSMKIQIHYLTDSNSKPIKKETDYSAPLSILNSSFSVTSISGRRTFVSSLRDGCLYFSVPESIGTIQLSFCDASDKVTVSCNSLASEIEYPHMQKTGDSSSRPQFAYIGQYYYDSTLGSYITWDGHVWNVL